MHRDIKPSNLLVDAAGRVKVVDFGVAAAFSLRLADLSTWTRPPATRPSGAVAAGEIAGTLLYMAPEQALGRPIDGRADLHALGVVLYELLAGAHPFRAASWAETLDAVLHREPPPLVSAAGGDPRRDELARLVAALVAKERDERPASAEVVVAALDAIRRGAPVAPPPPEDGSERIAVLPFANLSGHPEDDWIGGGIVETLASELAALPGFAVVPRDRVEEAARRLAQAGPESLALHAQRLGRALGARWAVAGALQRAGDRLRVTGQLLDVATGAAAGTLKEDGALEEIFALQDRLAATVARGLSARTPSAAAADETRVVAAYEALSRGLLNLRSETYEGLDRAILFFERAVELDPRYVRALVELGAARAQQADYLGAPELLERALAALRSALSLAPSHARARRELGATLVSAGRDEEGIAAIEQALAAAPDESSIVGGYGRALLLGRGDFAGAARQFERAVELQPLAGWYWLQLAHCRTLARELEPAREAAERAIALQERFLSGREGQQIVGAYMRRGHVAALEGKPQEAVAAFQQELAFLAQLDHALRGRIRVELNLRLGNAWRALGATQQATAHLDAALAAFERRVAMGADDAATRYYAAGIHALRGERENALAELGRAIAAHPRFNRARAAIEPEFDALRDDAEFRALLGR